MAVAGLGVLAFTGLGFGLDGVHVTAVDLVFVGGTCPGWSNATATGVSGNAGSHVSIPIPLSNEGAAGECVAGNVSATPTGFTIVAANTPLPVSPGATEVLALTVGLPPGSYTGPLTLTVWVIAPS